MKLVWMGYTAMILSVISLLPALYKTVIEKNTHSYSYLYIIIGFISQLCWLIYSIENKNYPLGLLAIYLMIVFLAMTISKWYYEKTHQDVYSKLKKKLDT